MGVACFFFRTIFPHLVATGLRVRAAFGILCGMGQPKTTACFSLREHDTMFGLNVQRLYPSLSHFSENANKSGVYARCKSVNSGSTPLPTSNRKREETPDCKSVNSGSTPLPTSNRKREETPEKRGFSSF